MVLKQRKQGIIMSKEHIESIRKEVRTNIIVNIFCGMFIVVCLYGLGIYHFNKLEKEMLEIIKDNRVQLDTATKIVNK